MEGERRTIKASFEESIKGVLSGHFGKYSYLNSTTKVINKTVDEIIEKYHASICEQQKKHHSIGYAYFYNVAIVDELSINKIDTLSPPNIISTRLPSIVRMSIFSRQ